MTTSTSSRSRRPSLWRRFTRSHAGCWPWGHLAGWEGPSGYGSRTTALEVVNRESIDLFGKVAIVTGGNAGIGRETAKALALSGATVIIACRDIQKGQRAAEELISWCDTELQCRRAYLNEEETKEKSARTDVRCLELDLASLESVRRFVAAFLALGLPLHILVNNAGTMPCKFELTDDGFEYTFQVNVLSPFLLTAHLTEHMRTLPTDSDDKEEEHIALAEAAPFTRRIVNVTSAVHRFSYPGGLRPNASLAGPEAADHYDPVASYAQSKLAVLLWTRDLHARLRASRRAPT